MTYSNTFNKHNQIDIREHSLTVMRGLEPQAKIFDYNYISGRVADQNDC